MSFDLNAIMVGDSITDRCKPYLQAMRPNWKIDGVPGRNVRSAPSVIRTNLAAYGIPRRLIIALGQNDDPGWEKADYRALVDLVPRATAIFFVTTWKDAALKGEEEAAVQGVYSIWMRQIAANQANVEVIEWRNLCYANRDPETGLCTLLDDGSHPVDPEGRIAHATLVRDTVAQLDP